MKLFFFEDEERLVYRSGYKSAQEDSKNHKTKLIKKLKTRVKTQPLEKLEQMNQALMRLVDLSPPIDSDYHYENAMAYTDLFIDLNNVVKAEIENRNYINSIVAEGKKVKNEKF